MPVSVTEMFASPCFNQRRWRDVHCSRVEAVSSREKQNTEFRLADARGVFQHRLEHGLKVTGRAGDDAQYVRGGRLLLERIAQLVEQARILDGDDRLVGEGSDQRDLVPNSSQSS
jgi:hypothetical protein